MNSSRTLRFLAAGAVTAVLVACGGGGGGGGGGTTTPTAPTAPTNTGLAAPNLVLNQSAGDAYNLVTEMVLTYTLAQQAQAANALGALAPGVGSAATSPYSCSSGTIAFTDNAGVLSYTYNNCSDGVYSFSGTGSQVVTTTGTGGAVTSYELVFGNVAATGPGSLSTTLSGTLTCTPAAAAGQKPLCVTTLGGYIWGYDISYSGSLANGSHQCNCGQGSWNVTFKNFGPTSGTAEVFASNASAIVTRTGDKTFTVVMFVGSDVKTYTVTLP